MAQQVVIAGALFNDVPSISVPDSNNVWHPFLDTTIASNAAAASDIAQGKLAYVNGSLVTGTASGGGGGGLEYETGTWTPASDTASATISFSKTHTTAPWFYAISDAKGTYSNVQNSAFGTFYVNHGQIFGEPWNVSTSSLRHAVSTQSYRSTSDTAIQVTASSISYPYTDSGNATASYSRYWATETGIKAYAGSSSRYWRSGRTYKWIAVWAPTS